MLTASLETSQAKLEGKRSKIKSLKAIISDWESYHDYWAEQDNKGLADFARPAVEPAKETCDRVGGATQ